MPLTLKWQFSCKKLLFSKKSGLFGMGLSKVVLFVIMPTFYWDFPSEMCKELFSRWLRLALDMWEQFWRMPFFRFFL